jgi:hypothetical protein
VELVNGIGFVVGVVSFVASIVFFVLGSRSERRNQDLLNTSMRLSNAGSRRSWLLSIELLNSRPEIVAKNASLQETRSKAAFVEQLGERIRHIIENPVAGEGSPAQSHALSQLLQAFEASTKSSLPPELLAQIVMAKQNPAGGA